MKQIFRCGCSVETKMWSDRQPFFKVSFECPRCLAKRRNTLKPGFRTVIVGHQSLVIKIARVASK